VPSIDLSRLYDEYAQAKDEEVQKILSHRSDSSENVQETYR